MPITLFNTLTDQEKSDAVETLIEESTPRQDFFLLIVLAVFMASIGLLVGSTAVVIGSMLVAPILYPVLSFSLGVVMSDFKLVGRALGTIIKSIILAGFAGGVVSLFFLPGEYPLSDVALVQSGPSLVYAVIAVIAGLAASFAVAKPKLNAAFPGVAVSVTMIPPLAVFGIALFRLNWEAAVSAFLLFATNAGGIVFASLIVFSLMRFYTKRQIAAKAVIKENQHVAQEVKRAKAAQKT